LASGQPASRLARERDRHPDEHRHHDDDACDDPQGLPGGQWKLRQLEESLAVALRLHADKLAGVIVARHRIDELVLIDCCLGCGHAVSRIPEYSRSSDGSRDGWPGNAPGSTE